MTTANTAKKNEKEVFDYLLSWNPIFIAVASFWGSIVYYVFIISRLNYWQVPLEFISFETKEILQVAVISILIASLLIVILFYLILLISGIGSIVSDLLDGFGLKYTSADQPFLLKVIAILFSRETVMLLLWTFVTYFIYNAISNFEVIINNLVFWGLVIPSLPFIYTQMWNNRSNVYKNLKMSESENIMRGLLLFIVITALFISSIIIAFITGRMSAMNERSFYVLNTSPECVVLYSKSDRVICATIMASEQYRTVVYPAYSVWTIADNKELEMILRDIGPITVSNRRAYPGNLRPKIPTPLTPSPTPIQSPLLSNTPSPVVTPKD